jgi:D-alanyl-D-alanine carboxypeptidase
VALGMSAVLLAACSAGSGGNAATVEAIGAHSAGRMQSATAKELEAVLDNAVKLSGATGGIAGVWAPWAGTWTSASGVTSTAKGAPDVDVDASFRIGSLTKPLTCTVLLNLVAEHKVELDDEVTKYLPRMVGLGGLQLGDLCHNTSGFPDYWGPLTPQMVTNPTRPWDALELINSAMGMPRAGAPGQTWSYSNAGFVLLGMALQAATHKNWSQLYEQYVTDPLGISDSTTYPTSGKLPGPTLSGYSSDRDVVTSKINCKVLVDESELSPSGTQQAGGIVSNLRDTASIAHAVAAGSLLPSATYAAEQQKATPMIAGMPSWALYGLGVEKMGPLIGHASAVPGTMTAAYSDPASGLTVVIMVNNSTPGANFVRLAALELASIASKAAPAQGKKAPNLSLPWTAAQLGEVMKHQAGCNSVPGALDASLEPIRLIRPSY